MLTAINELAELCAGAWAQPATHGARPSPPPPAHSPPPDAPCSPPPLAVRGGGRRPRLACVPPSPGGDGGVGPPSGSAGPDAAAAAAEGESLPRVAGRSASAAPARPYTRGAIARRREAGAGRERDSGGQ